MSVLIEISEALQKGRAIQIKALISQALVQGLSARQILDEGLLLGMTIIGEKFKNNDIFVPEVLIASRTMNVGTEYLRPYLSDSSAESKGKVVIGTVKGDLHDIGKNIVRMMMEGKGLEVIDLGVDVSAEKFVQAAIDYDCKIIACSALLTSTMPAVETVVNKVKEVGIRSKVKIMVGGGPVTDTFCKNIGADAYTPDGASAAQKAVELLSFC